MISKVIKILLEKYDLILETSKETLNKFPVKKAGPDGKFLKKSI